MAWIVQWEMAVEPGLGANIKVEGYQTLTQWGCLGRSARFSTQAGTPHEARG